MHVIRFLARKQNIFDRFSFEIFQEPSESFTRILNAAKVETSVPSAIEQECRYFLVVVRW